MVKMKEEYLQSENASMKSTNEEKYGDEDYEI